MRDGKSYYIKIMKKQIMFSGLTKIAVSLFAFLFLSVISNAQDYQYKPQDRNEMTSLKRLVLGINNTNHDKISKVKVLKNIDFELYVEREILIEKWMHDRNYWMHNSKEADEPSQVEDRMHRNGAWKLIDSDLGLLQKPEQEPKIELTDWMYAGEFLQRNSSNITSQLGKWMSDRSYWAKKK